MSSFCSSYPKPFRSEEVGINQLSNSDSLDKEDDITVNKHIVCMPASLVYKLRFS